MSKTGSLTTGSSYSGSMVVGAFSCASSRSSRNKPTGQAHVPNLAPVPERPREAGSKASSSSYRTGGRSSSHESGDGNVVGSYAQARKFLDDIMK